RDRPGVEAGELVPEQPSLRHQSGVQLGSRASSSGRRRSGVGMNVLDMMGLLPGDGRVGCGLPPGRRSPAGGPGGGGPGRVPTRAGRAGERAGDGYRGGGGQGGRSGRPRWATRNSATAVAQAVAITLTSRMTSKPTQATFQCPAVYRVGSRTASATVHPTRPVAPTASERTSTPEFMYLLSGTGL